MLAVLTVALLATEARRAHAASNDPPYTSEDTQAAIDRASPRAQCIVRYEAPSMNPYTVGDNGHSVGVAQIHDQGLLGAYERWTAESFGVGAVADRTSPYLSVAFLEWALRNGLAHHWTPVLRGLC